MSQVGSQIGQNVQLVPQILDQYELQRPKKVALLDEATIEVFAKYQSDKAEKDTFKSIQTAQKDVTMDSAQEKLKNINEDFQEQIVKLEKALLQLERIHNKKEPAIV